MLPWGGTIVYEPCLTEARRAAYSPCHISSSLTPQPPTPDYEFISCPFYMDQRYSYFVCMASLMRRVIGGRLKRFMDLYALESIIPFVFLPAYYLISSSQSALILSTLSTPY
eukprot:6176220-Pleurochrysis_carterae.AAC.2